MGYETCMKLAGAKILAFEEFGSYQGDWWAKVDYKNNIGWVYGYFGSCSGCDSFQAEFGYDDHEHTDNKYFSHYNIKTIEDFHADCEECQDLKKRMIEFGESYLDVILTQEEAETEVSKNIEWDMDAKEMLEFIKQNKL